MFISSEMSFEEFKEKVTTQVGDKQKIKSEKEILKDVENMMKSFKKGDT